MSRFLISNSIISDFGQAQPSSRFAAEVSLPLQIEKQERQSTHLGRAFLRFVVLQ
jgi:hypothetical protein